MIIGLLAQAVPVAPAQAAEAAGMSPDAALTWAIVLLLLSVVLAVVEFLVVSWGMLLIGATVSAIAAVALAFHADPVAGWIFVILLPILGVAVARVGFRLMRRNTAAILPTEITAVTGPGEAAQRAGIAPGTLGELVTAAYPTGRARFNGPHGPVTIDVQVQGGALARGDRVVVLGIDGPVISVAPARDTVSTLLDTNTNQG